MVERPEQGAESRVQEACKDLKVVRFQRSGRAIQVVNRMGAAGRLLRFKSLAVLGVCAARCLYQFT